MGAIRKNYNWKTTLRRTVNAGLDVLLFSNNTAYESGVATRVVNRIYKLIQDGTIREEAILRSNRRIQQTLLRIQN